MASTNSPYGLRPINLLGGQAYAGSTRLYAISPSYAVNIQYGDPVIIINTGSTAAALRGNLARFNATTTATTVTSTGGGFGFVGVFVGCTFTDPTYGKVFRQNYTASNAATEWPCHVIASTSGLKRRPSQTAQGTNTSERNCISTRSLPNPWQWSQRPSPELKEKLDALKPAASAAGTAA